MTEQVPAVPSASPLPSVDPPPFAPPSGPPVVGVGRYELRERLGAGNHGVVFRARDHHLGRDVAIKRFSHFLADDPRAMRRITREVDALTRVHHPHVVTVFDLVDLRDGDGEVTPHLIMELIEGRSLRELLNQHGPDPRALVVIRAVLEGLAACHAAGILHLDIKPANILVTSTGGVKIVDFGIARAGSESANTATVAGTPPYMAPEQADAQADERTDLYAVGCLLFECLAGRTPFEGSPVAQMLAHRTAPRPDVRQFAPTTSPALAAIVQRAMAISPAERYADAQAMLAALDVAERQPDGGSPGPIGPPPRPAPGASAPPVLVREPDMLPPEPTGARVTRLTKSVTYASGLTSAALVVALVPLLVWALVWPVPEPYRPPFMREDSAAAWWMIAVGIAVLILRRRRSSFLTALGGPPIGAVRHDGLFAPGIGRGLWIATVAALWGSIPMLLPLYVAGVEASTRVGGARLPSDLWVDQVATSWVFLPLIAFLLCARALLRTRARVGSVLLALLSLAAAAAATFAFVLYLNAF